MQERLLNEMSSDGLPKFRNPPVIETVLGVQFKPLPRLGNAYLGAFWRSLGEDWPHVSDDSVIAAQHERFGESKTWRAAGLQLKLSPEMNIRLKIRNRDKDRMIQIQNSRLHYNWLAQPDRQYPSYNTVKPEFDRTLDIFEQFIDSESLGEFQPNQWEVTYVNHIPKGTVWNSPKDWVELFSSLAVLATRGPSVHLESFGGEWHYEIEPERGRLHANLSHGWRKTPVEQEVLVLNLTARGAVSPAEEGGLSLDEGLSVGHETIVRAFKDLTSEKAHRHWELIDDQG